MHDRGAARRRDLRPVAVIALIVLAALVGALGLAAVYDLRQRRRGVSPRHLSQASDEAIHHRLDINAVPYEPARHAGQRDWATYRRRDRKRGRPA